MIRVSILGGGNVAHHLAHIFYKRKGVLLVEVYNRTLESIHDLRDITSITNQLSKLKKADIYIVSVADDAIELVSNKLSLTNALIVHTSGSTSIDVLSKHEKIGVFYPLQTFSKDRKLLFKDIPICIEANTQENLNLLDKLALRISDKRYFINSFQREKLHIAAVFVNNFVNHLYHTANDLCDDNHVSYEILKPLIIETANKIKEIPPEKAQTGPARRGDQKTINKHLKELNEKQQEIYKLLSNSISDTYGKKL
jgi:predicted short-subunit dehydrogenase-like oxidoreductase (DUF2520 family)